MAIKSGPLSIDRLEDHPKDRAGRGAYKQPKAQVGLRAVQRCINLRRQFQGAGHMVSATAAPKGKMAAVSAPLNHAKLVHHGLHR
jgi:hypothetical protein